MVWLPCPVRENAWEGVKWPVLKLPLEHTIPHLGPPDDYQAGRGSVDEPGTVCALQRLRRDWKSTLPFGRLIGVELVVLKASPVDRVDALAHHWRVHGGHPGYKFWQQS